MVNDSLFDWAQVEDELSIFGSCGSIWSQSANIIIERTLWASILDAQLQLGLKVTGGEESVAQVLLTRRSIDLTSIRDRELVTRHDLKARLEETVAVAGIPEVLHLGCTSADIVENSYLFRMALTVEHLRELGASLEPATEWMVWRGVKGPVGTQDDQVTLLGSIDKVMELDQLVAERFGFDKIANSVPQVMYRSADLDWATRIFNSVPEVDRSTGVIMSGLLSMLTEISGTTWNEGDVSTSVVRRYALPMIAKVMEDNIRRNQ